MFHSNLSIPVLLIISCLGNDLGRIATAFSPKAWLSPAPPLARHQGLTPCPYSLQNCQRIPRSLSATTLRSSQTDSDSTSATSATTATTTTNVKTSDERDLHPPTLQAIAYAFLLRAQNVPNMPLRFVEDGSMEPWEITLSAGKIAQRFVEEWRMKDGREERSEKDEEEEQVVAGRIVAVLTRFEELEEELLSRISKIMNQNDLEKEGNDKILFNLGIPVEELKAWQSNAGNFQKQTDAAAAAIDAASLFDEQLRYNRAKSLFAMFLHELEGPGLRKNNVVLPCMDVDFLEEQEWAVLFGSEASGKNSTTSESKGQDEQEDQTKYMEQEKDNSIKQTRPSLHPITIEAVEEALRLRAQNKTTSPLRLIDDKTEWFEVQYSCVKFADRFLEKFKPNARRNANADVADMVETTEFSWTEEELQTIGGRIVGVLMRLDDLEWEWNHRICTSPLGQSDSPTRIPYEQWKVDLGLHPNNMEQICFKTVDLALLEEKEFARSRAERMLALFLLNIEGPALKASGNEVPGGSEVDFIDDLAQLELMMPRIKK